MRCFKCASEYDDSLNACPKCGAAAALPVIPDTEVKLPKAKKLPAFTDDKPKKAQTQAASVFRTEQSEPAAAVSDGSKKIIAVLAVLLVIMTAAVVVLLIDRSRLKAENKPDKYTNSIASPSSSTAKVYTPEKSYTGSVQNSNTAARIIFSEASAYAYEREMSGDPIPYGVVFSSADIGTTSPAIADDFDTVPNLTNTIKDSLGYDFGGYEWIVAFDGCVPTVVYAAPNVNSVIIGSYPLEAESESLISMREAADSVDYHYVNESKSANDLYGQAE